MYWVNMKEERNTTKFHILAEKNEKLSKTLVNFCDTGSINVSSVYTHTSLCSYLPVNAFKENQFSS